MYPRRLDGKKKYKNQINRREGGETKEIKMAKITLQGNEINTVGNLPKTGDNLSGITAKLTKGDLSDVQLSEFKGKKVILNIFPSIDTPVCAASVRKFNQEASNIGNTKVLCISRDLPFAQGRFCVSEGIENVINLSEFKDTEFSTKIGVKIKDGPMEGLMARAVLVLDEDQKIIYSELVPEIVQEPNYENALKALK
jgi:thioredoxin-dependent peroxiredoxin